MKWQALIVEDEPVARRALRSLVNEVEWLACIGEAATGPEAVRLINALEPHIAFLDIRLPGLSGLEILESARHQPTVVFTTAHDEYAIRALQLGALDYLLKPFGRKRFLETVERIRKRMAAPASDGLVAERAREFLGAPQPLSRIFVQHGDQIVPMRLDRVQRIEASDDYAFLFSEGTKYLTQMGLGDLQPLLDPRRFARIHRSHIVNLDFVASFRPLDDRRYLVVLKDGSEIMASRTGTRLLRGLVV